VSYNQSSRYQKLASIPEKVFESVIREIAFEEEGELSEAGILARADRILRGVNIQQSESNEWYTPAHYIEAARATLGDIDLDPASNEIANQTVKATMFYTVDDDGLAHPWIGRVFLNPPYGRMAASFIERMATEYADGNVTAGIVLVNAHCTDTSWFQCLWEGVLCFTDHRIDFYRPGDVGENKSTHGSVFVYFGPSPERFAEEFEVFGAIVQRFA
jgi:ParB family chromosome partitioning protein